MKVLITGGAGYIGSTIASACVDHGIEVVVLDNLSTGRREFTQDHEFVHADVADAVSLERLFGKHPDIGCVIHCAALTSVPKSVAEPLAYYRENVSKTITLLEFLGQTSCRRVLFSSSAAVYRPSPHGFVREDSPLRPLSPYARTKAHVDDILADCGRAGLLQSISLRYFNPLGADPHLRSGQQAADSTSVLANLIRAYDTRTPFVLTGVDWDTRDGTGIRDYVHVWDVALAHVLALQRFDEILPGAGHEIVNLGSGAGTTVRELHAAFERVVGSPVPVVESTARPGDVIGGYANADKAARLLGWTAASSVEAALESAVRWKTKRLALLGY